MKKAKFPTGLACMLIVAVLAGSPGCGKDGSAVIDPGADTGAEHWWDNYLDATGNPVTLPSGFKLARADGSLRTVSPATSSQQGLVLSFAVEPYFRSNAGYLFRGNNQNNADLENLAGAVEFIKQSGWLRQRETFDWEGLRETPPGSFKFTRINRFTKFSIRSTFNGFATDLMLTLLSEPYIGFPTDTTRKWNGKPVYVSSGIGNEFIEIFSYGIRYIGRAELKEGSSTLATYDDVILIEGVANQGQGHIRAYLAPNVGIIHYHLTTAFGQPAAGALVGFSGENLDIGGSALTDYMPLAPGNHWLYEFSPDDRVAQFRFQVVPVSGV